MTATSTAAAQERLALWGPRLIVAFTVAALVLVGLGAGGPLRQATTALAVLVAPGLAASLAMGPMSLEARALVSVVASAALLAVVSMVMALLGSSSTITGLWVSALVAFALILLPFLRGGRTGVDPPSEAGNEGDTSAPTDARSGAHHERDGLDEGGDG